MKWKEGRRDFASYQRVLGTFMKSQKGRLMRLMGVAAIAGFAIFTPGAAFGAGYRQGTNYYYTVVFPYYNWAAINTTTGQPAEAITELVVNNNGSYNLPSSPPYLGVYEVMKYSNGNICQIQGWAYNSIPAYELTNDASPGCGAGPTYYSQGATASWNGLFYSTFFTNPSPDEGS
jgi:hypothetical protein